MPDNFFQTPPPVPTEDNNIALKEALGASIERSLFTKVFAWMGGALLVTALTALVVASTSIGTLLVQNSALFFGIIIAELILVFTLSARIQKMSFPTAALMMIVYAMLNGVVLSSIFFVYSFGSIAKVFFITAGMFGAMALYGATTKRNLSALHRVLMLFLLGVIIASLVNLFFRSSALDWLISLVGVVLFTILTAVDTNRIKRAISLRVNEDGETESLHKLALMGSLILYLDFINLFLYLLRFFGSRD